MKPQRRPTDEKGVYGEQEKEETESDHIETICPANNVTSGLLLQVLVVVHAACGERLVFVLCVVVVDIDALLRLALRGLDSILGTLVEIELLRVRAAAQTASAGSPLLRHLVAHSRSHRRTTNGTSNRNTRSRACANGRPARPATRARAHALASRRRLRRNNIATGSRSLNKRLGGRRRSLEGCNRVHSSDGRSVGAGEISRQLACRLDVVLKGRGDVRCGHLVGSGNAHSDNRGAVTCASTALAEASLNCDSADVDTENGSDALLEDSVGNAADERECGRGGSRDGSLGIHDVSRAQQSNSASRVP
eukprot:Opistho-2@94762